MFSRAFVGVLCLQAATVFALDKQGAAKVAPGVIKLLKEWQVDLAEVSTSFLPNTCLETVEALQKFDASQFQGCAEVKSLCAACSSCTKFTTLSQSDSSKKACVCAVGSDATTTGKLSQKDDCFISPFGTVFTGALTLDLSGGNDCAIVIGATQTRDVTINGGVGDDTLLNLDDKQTVSTMGVITFNGGSGNDCIYLQDNAQFAYGDAGNDVLILDTASGQYDIEVHGGADDDFIIAVPEIAFANMALIYGEDGDDQIFVGGGDVYNVYGGDGADKIVVLTNAYVEGRISGDDGEDKIIVHKHAYGVNVAGGDGNDNIEVHGAAGYVYGDDGADNVVVTDSADIFNQLVLGDGDNIALISGRVYDIVGGADKDLIEITGDGIVANEINLYDGADEIIVSSSANVEGPIDLGDGRNVANIYGRVNQDLVGGLDGNKVYIGSDGTLNYITLGDGDDEVVAYGRVRNDIDVGAGANHVKLADHAFVLNVLAGDGDDIITVESSAQVVQEINAQSGDNQFSISGKVLQYVMGGLGDDIFKLGSDARVGGIADLGGDNIVYLLTNSNIDVPLMLGAGNDICYAPYNYDDVMDQCDVLHQSSN